MSITGEPGRSSVRIGPSAIDLLTGAHAAFGILVALRERDRSGRGQWLETSLYDSSVHLLSHFIADYTGSGQLQSKAGGSFPFLAPYGMYEARDREFFMGVGTDRMFGRLCQALGRDDLLDDSRFTTNDRRVEHRHHLDLELATIFRTDDAGRWVRLCHELEIPSSEVATDRRGRRPGAGAGALDDRGDGDRLGADRRRSGQALAHTGGNPPPRPTARRETSPGSRRRAAGDGRRHASS